MHNDTQESDANNKYGQLQLHTEVVTDTAGYKGTCHCISLSLGSARGALD